MVTKISFLPLLGEPNTNIYKVIETNNIVINDFSNNKLVYIKSKINGYIIINYNKNNDGSPSKTQFPIEKNTWYLLKFEQSND